MDAAKEKVLNLHEGVGLKLKSDVTRLEAETQRAADDFWSDEMLYNHLVRLDNSLVEVSSKSEIDVFGLKCVDSI